MAKRCNVLPAHCLVIGLVLCASATSSVQAQDEDGSETAAPQVARSRASFELGRDKAVYELASARAELGARTTLWPWLTLGAGAVATLAAGGYGAARALECDDDCRLDAWIGPTAAIGAAVTAMGLLWLRWANLKRGALQSEAYRLERALEAVDANAPALSQPELGYSMRLHF